MWKYEVKFIEFKAYSELIKELNLMGTKGWEVFLIEKTGSEFKGYKSKVLFKKYIKKQKNL